MKKIMFFLTAVLLNAQTLNFILPFQNSQPEQNIQSGTLTVQNRTDKNETNTTSAKTNTIPKETNVSKSSLTADINITENNTSAEHNTTTVNIEDFNATYVSINNSIKLAIVINKKRFFRYLPSLVNSLDAYFLTKGVNFNIKVYNIDVNLSKIKADNILYFATTPGQITKLKDYNKTFYLPLINKNETNITAKNIYFGSINFKEQVKKLASFTDGKTDVIIDDTILAKKLFGYEKNLSDLSKVYKYPYVNYTDLNDSFVFFNISAGKTAQILSTITQKGIDTKLTFIPQLGYDPLMIMLTQPADIQKLLIANSILHPPLLINENANLLNSNIRYNWINYASCILADKAYNLKNGEDEFYMSDFNIYIFNNQINYSTKLYRIINGAFRLVE